LASRSGGVAEPVRRVARLLGVEMGWSPERVATESERFAEEAHREGLDLA
jgi:hypothetical protein